MIIKTSIISDLEINSLEDLHKLKPIMEATNLKVNISSDIRIPRIHRQYIRARRSCIS